MSASVTTKRKRTRRERIDTLVARYVWLKQKRAKLEAEGRPVSYLREEMDALAWALPILEREVDAPSTPGASYLRVAQENAADAEGAERRLPPSF